MIFRVLLSPTVLQTEVALRAALGIERCEKLSFHQPPHLLALLSLEGTSRNGAHGVSFPFDAVGGLLAGSADAAASAGGGGGARAAGLCSNGTFLFVRTAATDNHDGSGSSSSSSSSSSTAAAAAVEQEEALHKVGTGLNGTELGRVYNRLPCSQVRKRMHQSFAPFYTKKDHFTKTGSGQT
jgi:hypothetical protein